MRNATAIARNSGQTEAVMSRGDDWLESSLDEGAVLRWQAPPAAGEAAEDDLTWLVPDRDGDGYVAIAVCRDCDLVEVIALDD